MWSGNLISDQISRSEKKLEPLRPLADQKIPLGMKETHLSTYSIWMFCCCWCLFNIQTSAKHVFVALWKRKPCKESTIGSGVQSPTHLKHSKITSRVAQTPRRRLRTVSDAFLAVYKWNRCLWPTLNVCILYVQTLYKMSLDQRVPDILLLTYLISLIV